MTWVGWRVRPQPRAAAAGPARRRRAPPGRRRPQSPLPAGDRPIYTAPALSPDGTDLYVVDNAFTHALPVRHELAARPRRTGAGTPTSSAGVPSGWSSLDRSAVGDPRGDEPERPDRRVPRRLRLRERHPRQGRGRVERRIARRGLPGHRRLPGLALHGEPDRGPRRPRAPARRRSATATSGEERWPTRHRDPWGAACPGEQPYAWGLLTGPGRGWLSRGGGHLRRPWRCRAPGRVRGSPRRRRRTTPRAPWPAAAARPRRPPGCG